MMMMALKIILIPNHELNTESFKLNFPKERPIFASDPEGFILLVVSNPIETVSPIACYQATRIFRLAE
jgi:hypothetical protein